jgi:peptide/nickel transport system permease protein
LVTPVDVGWLERWRVENQWRIREIKFLTYLFRKSPLSMLGLAMVTGVVTISLLAPYLATHDPLTVSIAERFQPPSWNHYFGTDDLGMDIYSRVLHAGLYDLSVALIVLIVSTSIGTMVGIVSGYYGGKIDELLMRISDIFLACPGLILAMGFSAAFKSRSLQVLVFAIALHQWPSYARLVRGQVLTVKENQYIEAARAIGSGSWSILFGHILPNTISPIIVNSTIDTGAIILTAATLSFIGLGAPPGTPEWGRMVAEGRMYIQSYPWIIIWPGLMIFIVVLGMNLLGDGLRDISDPRARMRT